ncbi:LuxR family transcriptional regulator AbsR2 [Streptomyces sp. KMM 9044]|uniref:LuxR family transcriptional regulator AbsR2 n=1 Tax=Streptomyces sp. KMM 9044 TaxID=2744474 RepID=UPI0021509DD2|nr:LuxR family transcriptional regulator [Streptomyces sp. KMM 9044]WAX81738.1 LuxR C-terminal-related transcriptional regulator [Streptomyces sp. KMM 9044]
MAPEPLPVWPFTGRGDELHLIRRSLTGARRGLVVAGPAGRGKTRLVTEAVRGTDCVRVTGIPQTHRIPFAAFAPLLPEPVTLHRAVRLLSGTRTLLVDDAHLLDDSSAALVHQLAVRSDTRLLIAVTDGAPVPAAVSRLWTGELLSRLALEPLPREETAPLVAAGPDGRTLEPLTVDRLHRLAGGDLRLLRELLGALRERGRLTRVPGTAGWAWRGPVPLTPAVRERTAHLLARTGPGERETLDRLAFAEPLPVNRVSPESPDGLALDALERLEDDGLVHVDDQGILRLTQALHGSVLRAAAGRLRARRLARAPEEYGPALAAEAAALTTLVGQDDVRTVPAPVGDWLVAEGTPVPAGYAALRARFARLRGEVREAAAWAREGLRTTPSALSCRTELALAEAQSGGTTSVRHGPGAPHVGRPSHDPYDAVRLGTPERAAGRLTGVFAAHADALAHTDGPALDRAAGELEQRGFLLFAAEAYAQAATAHRDPGAARTARTRAVTLARRCQGARTPALAGLVLGELTARQRQIVTLAATGLSNRQIAERLTLSVRTVGNHLYSAYTRLGASDRTALPRLTELRPTEPRSAEPRMAGHRSAGPGEAQPV